MAGEKSGSPRGLPLTFIGGVLLLAMLIVSAVSILGAVLLYTSFPLKPYPVHFLGIKLLPNVWIPAPNFGYEVFTNFISDLGVGPSSFIFNTGMIISGVLAVLVFPTLLRPLGNTGKAKIGVAFGIIAGVGLAGVGAFPENTGFYHVLFASIFFISIFIAAGVLSYANESTSFFSKTVQRLGYFVFPAGLVCTGLILIFGPPPEWALLLLLLIWALPLSIEMLAKGNRLQ
ncbi:MAG: DUF998 domain-containing protein [Candidatus Jordarchaeaceae archaeon]